MKKDNLIYGLVLGTLSPFLGMFVFYLWKFKAYSLKFFIATLGVEKRILTSMVTFSLIVNAIAFTIFINSRKDKTARGIFFATLVWALAAIFLKWWY